MRTVPGSNFNFNLFFSILYTAYLLGRAMSEHGSPAHWVPSAVCTREEVWLKSFCRSLRYLESGSCQIRSRVQPRTYLVIFMVLQFGIYTRYRSCPWSVRRCGSFRVSDIRKRRRIVILPTDGTQLLFVGLSVSIGVEALSSGRRVVRRVSALVRLCS